jgi:FkbM family methyltransferase
MDPVERRRFLVGALTGVAAAGPLGVWGGRASASHAAAKSALPPPPSVDSFPRVSFAQQGEDLIIRDMLRWFKITRPTYLDIGANDPVFDNNTYLFYLKGSRGVLVEPNPSFAAKLQKARPEDRVLAIGIGPTDVGAADYYMVRGDDQMNTFSKEQADFLIKLKGPNAIERVIQVPLVNVNEVIAENFDGPPNILSVDTEGFDLEILKSLDFTRFRPHVVCAETLTGETGLAEEGILTLMHSKGYTVRGATFVNTVFLANELLARGKPSGGGAADAKAE